MAFVRIPDPLPAAGFPVPIDDIQSSRQVLGFLPAYSRNSLSPRLVLHRAHLEIKVLTTSPHEYTALRWVDYRPAGFLRREQLILELHHPSHLTYYLKPASAAIGRALLQFWHQQGVALSEAARQHLAEPAL